MDRTDIVQDIIHVATTHPLKELLFKIWDARVDSHSLQELLKGAEFRDLPDSFKCALVNGMRDLETNGKLLSQVVLPVK